MPAIGQLGVEAISVNPGGSSVTLSPWLIQTLEEAVAVGGALVLEVRQQAGVPARPNLGIAELAMRARFDLAALLHGHREHAVADAEHRNAELEHRGRRPQLMCFVGRRVTTRQDHAFRCEVAHEGIVDVVRMEFAIDTRFAHAARDQLRDLRAEVENQNPVVLEDLTHR